MCRIHEFNDDDGVHGVCDDCDDDGDDGDGDDDDDDIHIYTHKKM